MEHEAGETLLAYALKEEYGIFRMPRIEKEKRGKPYFPDHGRIYFNISHSAGMVVCALTGVELGVDIDHVRRVGEGLYDKVLSAKEREWVARQPEREEAFIRLWTLKESYVKAIGEGIAAELSSIEFILPDGCITGEILCSREGYSFYQRKIGDKMYLALCVKGKSIPAGMKKLHIIF